MRVHYRRSTIYEIYHMARTRSFVRMQGRAVLGLGGGRCPVWAAGAAPSLPRSRLHIMPAACLAATAV